MREMTELLRRRARQRRVITERLRRARDKTVQAAKLHRAYDPSGTLVYAQRAMAELQEVVNELENRP